MDKPDSSIAGSNVAGLSVVKAGPSVLPPLSVIMPAYNEEGAIADAVQDVAEHVLACVAGAELVVVNDGSRDQTGAILDGLAAQDGCIRVVHQSNGGHGVALRTGLETARGEYVFLVDSDRQIPLDSFAEHWQAVHGHDALFGIRRRRHDPLLRLMLTRIVRSALRLLLGVSLRDANVPYKIVRRTAWERASSLIPPDTLAPSLFLAVIMRQRGESIVEAEVMHRERETGTVTLRYGRLLKFCLRGYRQLLTLRRNLKRGSESSAQKALTSA